MWFWVPTFTGGTWRLSPPLPFRGRGGPILPWDPWFISFLVFFPFGVFF